jgi:hypothetical protein
MLRLTLRTLLAYLDDTLPPADARQMGQKVAENPSAQELVERIRKVVRRRGLSTPPAGADGGPADPNTVAEYLSDALTGDRLTDFEQTCLEQDTHLAEVAAVHQILTMVLSEPVRVPPTAHARMLRLVKGKESVLDRKSGATTAVGGRQGDDLPAAEADDADAPLLLGLGSRDKAPGLTAGFALTAAGLAAAFIASAWLAIPSPAESASVADGGKQKATPPAVEVASVPSKPAAEPEKKPKPAEPAPPMKPEPAPEPKKEPPPEPAAPPPAPPAGPDAVPLVPTVPAPRADKVSAGQLARPANVVVLTRAADDDPWKRVAALDPTVPAAQTVVSLPGYRANVALDTGVALDLWGNLPDLLNAPGLLESRVTFHAPPDGFEADLSVHAGRVYLKPGKPAGAKVRLRFAGQVWDVALLDDKTDAAFEVVRTLARGRVSEPPAVDATLAVLAGSAGLTAGYKSIPAVPAGEVVTWDTKGKGLDGPKKLDPNGGGAASAYFNRFPLTTEAGKAVNLALDELSRRMADAGRAKAVFAEMLQGKGDPPGVAAARVGAFGAAAVGDWASLVDAINDGDRPGVRTAAVAAVRSALANDPGGAGEREFRRLLGERSGVTDDQFDAALRMLRGFGDAERKRPETMDLLVKTLDAPAVGLRELAILTLFGDVAPDARSNFPLTKYDAGGTDAGRAAAVRAWKMYAEDWKRKNAPPPGP